MTRADRRAIIPGMDEETRRFLDGLLRRHVEVTQALIESMKGDSRALQAESRALQAEIADQREQIRANTEATWRMLDRFGEGPSAA
jgi:hypothetical protein